ATGKRVRDIPVKGHGTATVSPDGTQILVDARDQQLHLVEVPSGKVRWRFQDEAVRLPAEVSHDGRLGASGSTSGLRGKVFLRDAATGQSLFAVGGRSALKPDEEEMPLWETRAPSALAFAPHCRTLAVAESRHFNRVDVIATEVWLWELATATGRRVLAR